MPLSVCSSCAPRGGHVSLPTPLPPCPVATIFYGRLGAGALTVLQPLGSYRSRTRRRSQRRRDCVSPTVVASLVAPLLFRPTDADTSTPRVPPEVSPSTRGLGRPGGEKLVSRPQLFRSLLCDYNAFVCLSNRIALLKRLRPLRLRRLSTLAMECGRLTHKRGWPAPPENAP